MRALVAAMVLVVAALPASASARTYANTTPITITDNAASAPYGTSITVADVPGLVSRVGVEFVGLHHGFIKDVRALLVSPAGKGMVLNRQGNLAGIDGDLRFDTDSKSATFSALPDEGVHAIEPDLNPGPSMPGAAPAQPYGGSLRPLLGGSPNGTWTLYVADVSGGASGRLDGGWRLHLDTTVDDRLRPTTNQVGIEGEDTSKFTLNRQTTSAALGALDLHVRTVDGTAKAGEDYTAVDRTVHFNSGQSQATVAVPLLGDDVAEGVETLGLEILDLPANVDPSPDPSPLMHIVDDDGPAGAYFEYDGTFTHREGGGGTGADIIYRSGSLAEPMSVTFGVLPGTVSQADMTSPTIALPAARRAGISLPTSVDDALDEAPSERGTLLVKANGATVASIPLVVLDNDGAAQSYLATRDPANEAGPANGSVSVSREGGTKPDETAALTVNPGTATLPADFTSGGSFTRSFFSGSDATVVNLPTNVLDDFVAEGTEELRVTLDSTSVSVVDPARQAVNVPLLDNEVPTGYGGLIAPKTFTQADEGTVLRVQVNRAGPAAAAVSAHWSTHDVTALAGRDYEAASGTVSWAAGDSAPKEIQVVTRQDALVEGEEVVGITLDAPTTSAAGQVVGLAPAGVDARIADDDTAGPGQLDLDAGDLTVREGDPIVVSVHRTLGSAGAVGVTCRVPGGPTTSVAFADAAAEGTCTLPTANDAVDAPDATLRVELADPTGGAVLGPRASRTVVVTDDDEPGTGALRFQVDAAAAQESAGTVPITVTRDPATTGTVDAQVALEAPSPDATLATQRVTIPAGQMTASVPLAIVDDGEDEADTEDVVVVLSDPRGGATLGSPARERIAIEDDDGPGTAAFPGTKAIKVIERKKVAKVVVHRRFGLAAGASVGWTVVPGSASRKDVGKRSGRVTFAAGAADATISVAVKGDRKLEKDETFKVLLSDARGGLKLGSPTSRGVKIVDDDGYARVKITTRSARVKGGRVKLRLACPRPARRPCAGRVSLLDGKTSVGAASYRVRPRRSRTVSVKVSGKATSVVARARPTSIAVKATRRKITLKR